ncbi:MAG: molybdopterin molybdotransferase MoeA [Steroidobacteraceae bacterium]
MSPEAAEAAIAAVIAPYPAESRALERCIGQTLREDIYAERENPPFDRVCMDGIAVASAALGRGVRRFGLQATQAAGVPALELAGGDHAIEVMTGAILPRGADCVIPLEEYDSAGAAIVLKGPVSSEPYRNVQRRGEDSPPGVPMLKAGVRLRAPELAVAASAGLASVRVTRQPAFMVISTGDELIEPGEPIADHQVRRSNAYAIIAALRDYGFESVANDHLHDEEALLRDRLTRHLAERDVLVLSGGISKGRFDLVPAVLRSLGVREVFHYVAQQPGRPMWFGVGPGGEPVFGLPGNPVATLVCLMRYVVPAITAAMGAPRPPPERIPLAEPVRYGRATTRFLPVSLLRDAPGRVRALPRPTNGPGDFLALAASDGFVELSPSEEYREGFIGSLYRW